MKDGKVVTWLDQRRKYHTSLLLFSCLGRSFHDNSTSASARFSQFKTFEVTFESPGNVKL